jgi:hypothetical protein
MPRRTSRSPLSVTVLAALALAAAAPAARAQCPGAPSISGAVTSRCATTLTWPTVPLANGYDIYRGTSPDPALAAIIGASGIPAYTDGAVAPNTTYTYWGRARSGPF